MKDDHNHNPYAPPEAEDLEAAPNSEFARAEQIRREHIKHEASIKSVGCLHLFGGIITVLGALSMIPVAFSGRAKPEVLGFLVGYAAVGVALVASGYGLRTLKPWTRVLSSILCGIGLLGFPIGTLINAYFLYLILSAKGTTVLSDEYKYVITATPHVKYVPWAAIILLVLLGVLFVGLIVAAKM